MGKIYSGIEGLTVPDITNITGDTYDEYEKACEKYVKEVKKYAKARSACNEAGEEIQFPVGDGYARYIVASLKPVELIHLNIGDQWHFQYVDRLTASDIKEKIRLQKSLKNLFSKAKALKEGD
jgi:hypothetical protein